MNTPIFIIFDKSVFPIIHCDFFLAHVIVLCLNVKLQKYYRPKTENNQGYYIDSDIRCAYTDCKYRVGEVLQK